MEFRQESLRDAIPAGISAGWNSCGMEFLQESQRDGAAPPGIAQGRDGADVGSPEFPKESGIRRFYLERARCDSRCAVSLLPGFKAGFCAGEGGESSPGDKNSEQRLEKMPEDSQGFSGILRAAQAEFPCISQPFSFWPYNYRGDKNVAVLPGEHPGARDPAGIWAPNLEQDGFGLLDLFGGTAPAQG